MTDLHDQRSAEARPAPPASPITKHERDEGRGHPARLLILVALLGWAFVAAGWALPVVILGVVVMIFLHELGHYLAAKWGGMKVTEFFIGFGPKIWSFRRGDTEYGLKVIPAGAYVKIIGMNNLDEVAPGDEDLAYREKSYPKRLLVAVAGSAMHFTQALVLLFFLYAFVGVPGGSLTEDKEWAVRETVADTPAEEAGLEPGDRVLSLDGRTFDGFTDFADAVSRMPGEEVVLDVVRDGERLQVPLEIGRHPSDRDVGFLGIRRELVTTTASPIGAVGNALSDFGDQSVLTLQFFGDFFTPSGIGDFASEFTSDPEPDSPVVERGSDRAPQPAAEPADDDAGRIISIVGAVQLGSNLTEEGMIGFLLFFVGINITIGIFNLLPVLPLDGGHVVVATYERIREAFRPGQGRYHVDFARLIPVVYAVFLLLVLLGVTTIWLDITDPVSL